MVNCSISKTTFPAGEDMGEETVEIVIVGGGICGLSLAIALQKKGLRDYLVLESSNTLRRSGSGIGVQANGWCALEQLGVASKLRVSSSFNIHRSVFLDLDSGRVRASPISSAERRCMRRSDLIDALAEEISPQTIRFGCEVVSVKSDDSTSTSIVQLRNGGTIRAKVVIGCDGGNSMIGDFLGLKPKKVFSVCGIRGLTFYPNGHGFSPEFFQITKGGIMSATIPIDEKLVYWFISQKSYSKDSTIAKDPNLIKQYALELIAGFPEERVNTITNCDLTSLTLTHFRYRAPWDLVFNKFRRGNVTVAGDAMHLMGPFLGQGGCAAMEDAVVLARSLSRRMKATGSEKMKVKGVQEALDEYVDERRKRLVMLSTQTYLTGVLSELSTSSFWFSKVLKMLVILVMKIMFRDPRGHARYDCGQL